MHPPAPKFPADCRVRGILTVHRVTTCAFSARISGGGARLGLVAGMVIGILWIGIPASTAAAAQDGQRRAQVSWWERTEKGQSQRPGDRRIYRADAAPAQVKALVADLSAGAADTTALLGPLRWRSLERIHGLVFRARDDYLDTLRTRFAVIGVGDAMAFSSPLGRGIACTIEDVPPMRLARAVRAAATDECCALAFGTELMPWLASGVADAVARRDAAPLDATAMQTGLAGIEAVRASLKVEGASAAAIARGLLLRTIEQWSVDSASQHGIAQEQASSIVRMLFQRDRQDGRGRIARMARCLNDGMTPTDAVADSLGLRTDQDWDAFGSAWAEFARAEADDPRQTAIERLAFLAEGIVALHADGQVPETFDALAAALADRGFAWPAASRPGWSCVKASDPASFSVPGGTWPLPPPEARIARGPRFLLERTSAGHPCIATEGLEDGDLRVTWMATRPEPEAPLVWRIVERHGPPPAAARPKSPPR